MDQATLVAPDIEVGNEALEALDESGIKANVALLMVTPDYGDWRMTISSPDLDQESLRHAYEQILTVWGGRFLYSLPQLFVMRQSDPFVKEMRRSYRKIKNVKGMRLGPQMIGDRFVEAGYVYRVR